MKVNPVNVKKERKQVLINKGKFENKEIKTKQVKFERKRKQENKGKFSNVNHK